MATRQRGLGRRAKASGIRPAISVSGAGDKVSISVRGDLEDEHLSVLCDVVDAALDAVRRADLIEVDLRGASSVGPAGLHMVARIMDAGVRLVVEEYDEGFRNAGT